MRFVEPDRDSGTSVAVIVRSGETLAHTALMRPVDRNGKIVDRGEAAAQADRVLANLNWALAAAGTGRENTVKMTVYVADETALAPARDSVLQAFPGEVRPAVTWIVNPQPDPSILVTMDAVAVAPRSDGVTLHVSDLLPSWHGAAHVSVTPPGQVFHLSGQTAEGATLDEAAANTIRALHRTLTHLGLGPQHIVQIKAFVSPSEPSTNAVLAIASLYDKGRCPPIIVSGSRATLPRTVEIEMIAVDSRSREEEPPVRYVELPWMSTSPGFSLVAVANTSRHGLIYFSGIVPPTNLSPESQIAWTFDRLQNVCVAAGSDFDHLVKATYYVKNSPMGGALRDIRLRYYRPGRSPAASLVTGNGGARPGTDCTLDMIGLSVVQPQHP